MIVLPLKHPLGGKKTGPNPTDRGKKGTKRSIITDAEGVPLSLVLEKANRHDNKLLLQNIDEILLNRPEIKQHFCADKAYDSIDSLNILYCEGYTPHVMGRGEEKKKLKKNKNRKARRWVIERTMSWINRYRKILIRWEKKAENYEALLHFAFAIISFKASGVLG